MLPSFLRYKVEEAAPLQSRRIQWMDSVRCLAMSWILFVHFISVFTPNTSVRFPGFWGLLLFGISGKLAVACFCVLLGYFASAPSRMSVPVYALRRYLFFALQILAAELLYYGMALLLPEGLYLSRYNPLLYESPQIVLPGILRDAFLLKAQVLPTYWCVDDFLLGSVSVFLLHKLIGRQKRTVQLLACAGLFGALLLLNQLWTAICVLGYALRLVQDVRLSDEPLVLIGLVLLLPWLIRRGECSTTYLLDGFACIIVLFILSRLPWCQRLLSFRPMARFGQHTFELFLLHVPIYQGMQSLLELIGWDWPPLWGYFLLFPALFALVTLAAFAWRKAAARTLLCWMKS